MLERWVLRLEGPLMRLQTWLMPLERRVMRL